MTTLKDLLRDLQQDTIGIYNAGEMSQQEAEEHMEALLEDYIIIIKERIIG